MKILVFVCIAFLLACGNPATTSNESQSGNPDSTVANGEPDPAAPTVYANDRFKDVTISKTGEHTWRASGKAQIFEATFGWVVEDGHDELVRGFHQTDAGAPDWGNFDFSVTVPANEKVHTLHLILFETSAEDGSRQHELAIPLNQ
jgi:hypothetical protein